MQTIHNIKLLLLGLLLVPFLLLTGCFRDKQIKKPVFVNTPTGFTDMKLLLKTLADTASFPYNQSVNCKAVEFLDSILTQYPEVRNNYGIMSDYGEQLLACGKTEAAIDIFTELVEKAKTDTSFTKINDLRKMLAISYFRLAEQSNCIADYKKGSCTLPFNQSTYHTDSFGVVNCIRLLEEVITYDSLDSEAKWLINIANSAIGRKADYLPAAWRIDFNYFNSAFRAKPMRDVAQDALQGVVTRAGGAAAEDFNNDGLIDLIITNSDIYSTMKYYTNNGDGTFIDNTEVSGLQGLTGGLNTTHMDFNNDGWEDIFVMRGGWYNGYGNYPNSLIRNNGDGTFTDITITSGLLSFHPTHSAAWADFNNDGLLDVFVGHEASDESDPHPSELYLNEGNEKFKAVGKECGISINTWVKGSIWFDYNNDGLQDLYVSNYGQENMLFRNNGKGKNGYFTFKNVAKEAKVELPLISFSVFSADINNDGWDDLFVSPDNSNSAELWGSYKGIIPKNHPLVFINNQQGGFTESSSAMHMQRGIYAMGLNYLDIDNDGWFDFFAGTGSPSFKSLFPNQLFRNNEGKYYEDISMPAGVGNLQKGHGIAVADFDNDGDNDIYINIGGFYESDIFRHSLFENPGYGNNYVSLRLIGSQSNKGAFGAKVKINVVTAGGNKSMYHTVNTGGSFGASSCRIAIGLGQAKSIHSIEITWPGNVDKTVYTNIEMNSAYVITEGTLTPQLLKLKSFKFK